MNETRPAGLPVTRPPWNPPPWASDAGVLDLVFGFKFPRDRAAMTKAYHWGEELARPTVR